MKAALVLPSQFPNGPKLAKVGCDTVYKPAAEPGHPRITQAQMDELRKHFKVGSMRDPSWTVPAKTFDNYTPEQKTDWARRFAQIFSDDFTFHSSPSFGRNPVQCYGLADIEYHSSLFVLEFFKAFRAIRNKRIVVWAPESMQGGWMEPELVSFINADPNILVAKQNYTGDMREIDGSVSTKDLLARGIRAEKVTSFHSLRKPVPEWWDGILYLEAWEQLAA
jgi:hypothetical protein